jgi:hypothetical protein
MLGPLFDKPKLSVGTCMVMYMPVYNCICVPMLLTSVFLGLGTFNPFSGDPLPANPKKQLILKVISGQQLPKPPDSMFGDRGEVSYARLPN